MISEFVKRPSSRRLSNLKPVTGKINEANKRQSEECFEIGKKHMIKKQYDQALKHYSNAVIHNPQNFKALCNMGLIYKENGRYNEARSCYSRALFAKPDDYIGLYNLGNLERVTGNYELAISYYNKILAVKQNQNVKLGEIYYNTLINQGICYKNLRLYDEALSFNNRATQVNPNDETAHFNKSMCLLKKIYGLLKLDFSFVRNKMCQQARISFTKVLSLNPNNFTAKISLIELKYLQNCNEENLKQAIKQFEELKKTAPIGEIFEIDLKIKYCQNLLKNLIQRKATQAKKQKQEKLKKVQKITVNNKYDKEIQSKRTKNIQEKSKVAKERKIEIQRKRSKTKQSDGEKNKYDMSDMIGESIQYKNQEPFSRKEEEESRNILKKKTSFSIQVQNYLNQGKSLQQIVDILIESKKYEQAFEIARSLPDSKQKTELQITINFLESQQTENDAILSSALSLYKNYIIMNNEQTPITKDTCSLRGHRIMATLLNITQHYAQASKHYQILLQLLQDQKIDQSKDKPGSKTEIQIKDIRAELGVCYAESGMLKQAIAEYRKSLQEQPDNYFIMTNMCNLLIQDEQKEEAKKYYEEYLKKKGGENMPEKIEYVDCLLNISICQRDTNKQVNAIEKALAAVEKYFPTYHQIKQNLNQTAILGLYLRKADLLQQKHEKTNLSQAQKRQNNEKLLDLYLTCLQFEVCPDRQAISANTGILFYTNGCYANALAFFKTIAVNRNLVANNMGLTFIHLQEYEKALTCFQFTTQEYPQNIIYATNFEILKWICGISNTKIITKYDCQCEAMFTNRNAFGLWMLDELTSMIEKNEVRPKNDRDSQNTVEFQMKNIIAKLLETSEKIVREKHIKSKKVIFFKQILDNHMKLSHQTVPEKKKLVSSQILDMSLKKCKDNEQLTTNMNSLIAFLSTINEQYNQQYFIIQTLVCFTIVINSHLKDCQQILKDLFRKSQDNILSQMAIFLENRQFKQTKEQDILQKQIPINYPNIELKLKTLLHVFKDIECLAQNSMQYILEHIENVYYSNVDSITFPLDKQYLYPHCQNLQECPHCIINSTTLLSGLFGNKMENPQSLGKNWTIKHQSESFVEKFHEFVQKNLQNQVKGIYSKQDKRVKVRLQSKYPPFRYVTYHKTFQQAQTFLKSIDQSFIISTPTPSTPKGIITALINRSICLNMWWGKQVTTFDKFYKEFINRESNLIHDSIYLLNNNMEQLLELFENEEESWRKIKNLFGIS